MRLERAGKLPLRALVGRRVEHLQQLSDLTASNNRIRFLPPWLLDHESLGTAASPRGQLYVGGNPIAMPPSYVRTGGSVETLLDRYRTYLDLPGVRASVEAVLSERCALSLLPLNSEAFPELPATVSLPEGTKMHAPCANVYVRLDGAPAA